MYSKPKRHNLVQDEINEWVKELKSNHQVTEDT